ncbi:MAG TPA: hypothetical protein VFF27_05195 [Bacteroidia bacterium]|nr:hypothetical protein [Bacteroidia bacterium]
MRLYFNTRKTLNLVKACSLVPFSSLFLLNTCNTDTDPYTVSPSARLQIYSTKEDVNIDILADGKTTPATPSGTTVVHPENIIIQAMGTQPDRNVKTVKLTMRCLSRRCISNFSSGYTTDTAPPVAEPCGHDEYEVVTVNATSGGVGILPLKYYLKDLAKRYDCPLGYPTVEAEVIIALEVTNIRDRRTKTPAVKLKMVFNPAEIRKLQ